MPLELIGAMCSPTVGAGSFLVFVNQDKVILIQELKIVRIINVALALKVRMF